MTHRITKLTEYTRPQEEEEHTADKGDDADGEEKE